MTEHGGRRGSARGARIASDLNMQRGLAEGAAGTHEMSIWEGVEEVMAKGG